MTKLVLIVSAWMLKTISVGEVWPTLLILIGSLLTKSSLTLLKIMPSKAITILYNDYDMKKGLLIVYSGPSGVGKSTVREIFSKDESLKLTYSISMTTRAPREGEKEGVDYFFVSKERFLQAIENGELLEHACFVDNYYGSPRAYIEKLRNQGKNVILEIEIDGAKQVMEKVPECVSIYVLPPSMEELEKRIRGRNTEKEEVILSRLNKAKEEIKLAGIYKYNVVNNDIEKTALEITNIIKKEMEAQ